MRSFNTRVLLATAAIIILVSLIHAQTQYPVKNVRPGSSVSGRVTLKGKGVPGVVVALRKPDASSPFEVPPRAITDQEGNYRINGVKAGEYMVMAAAPALVSSSSDGLNRRIVITDDDNVENINFSLVKGGVITGKIIDADTRPVIQTQVRLYRMPDQPTNVPTGPGQPAPMIYPSGSQTTDDRGIYRFFGLAAGKYTVAVGRDNQGLNGSSRSSYKEVFYPDVTDRLKATILEVTEGSESKDIDIAMGRPLETFNVSGRVIDGERGEGIPNVRLSLQQILADRGTFLNAMSTTNSRGEFRAENLVPGKYLVYPYQDPNAELRPEKATFEVIDADVTGITIRMVKGSSVSGTVVLDTENPKAYERLSKLNVQVFVQNLAGDGNPSGSSSRGSIAPDGSFRVGGLGPGTAFIQLLPTSGMDEMKGFGISQVTRDGVPIAPRALEIKDGDQITGIKISVVYGSATLRGLVNLENGTLAQGQRIGLRIVRGGDLQYANIRPPVVDSRGRFIAEGLPPGSYEIWVNVMGVRRPIVKQTVVLQDGLTTDVTINYDMSEKTTP